MLQWKNVKKKKKDLLRARRKPTIADVTYVCTGCAICICVLVKKKFQVL